MNSRMTVTAVRRFALLGAIGAVSLTVLGTSGDASAQIAGTTNKPLPNVLLLVADCLRSDKILGARRPKGLRAIPRLIWHASV